MKTRRLALLAVLVLLPFSALAVNYPLLESFTSPTDTVVTADGAVWVSSGAGLYRLDRGFGTFSKVSERYLEDLLVAADGAVWGMELGAGSLYRIDPANLSVQAFPFPGESLNMMAAGPDGMIWLSIGGDTHRIARMTPAGNIVSSVAAVEPAAQPPGGNVVTAEGWWWLGGWATGRLDLIAPSGTTQSFTIDVPFARWVLSGGDFLWVIGRQGDVAKIGLNGAVIARYKPAQELWGVAVDGEGDLWFREHDQLFQLTRDGLEAAHDSLPPLPCLIPRASYIAFGPAGEIVVTTAYDLNLIGILPPCQPGSSEVVTILQPSHAGPAHEVPTAGIFVLLAMAGILAVAGVFLTRS
jgi:hypothetical protein